jgi:hypothetical protein
MGAGQISGNNYRSVLRPRTRCATHAIEHPGRQFLNPRRLLLPEDVKKFVFAESVARSRFGRLGDAVAHRDQGIAGTKWGNALPVNYRSTESKDGPVRLEPLHSIIDAQDESCLVSRVHISEALALGVDADAEHGGVGVVRRDAPEHTVDFAAQFGRRDTSGAEQTQTDVQSGGNERAGNAGERDVTNCSENLVGAWQQKIEEIATEIAGSFAFAGALDAGDTAIRRGKRVLDCLNFRRYI